MSGRISIETLSGHETVVLKVQMYINDPNITILRLASQAIINPHQKSFKKRSLTAVFISSISGLICTKECPKNLDY